MKTHIAVVLDRSTSMHGVAEEATKSVNDYIKGLKHIPGKTRVTLTQFNEKFEVTCNSEKRKNVPKLKYGKNYNPSGWTALYDAIGYTIPLVKSKKNVVLVIVTDGEENSSREFDYHKISKLIKKCQKKGWEIVFLASDMKSVQTAQDWGIDKTFTYTNDSRGYAANTVAMASATMSYATSNLADDDNIVFDDSTLTDSS